jgi:hypothetical protein
MMVRRREFITLLGGTQQAILRGPVALATVIIRTLPGCGSYSHLTITGA